MANNDPIQGLIDYVNEIKPFHSKILEVAVAYAQNDDVDITFTEEFGVDVSIFWPALADDDDVPIRNCPEGWGVEYDRATQYIVIDASISPQTVTLSGDQSAFFAEGTRFEIREPTTEQGSPLPSNVSISLQNIVITNASSTATTDRIFTSSDGVNWTKRTATGTGAHNDVAYSPTLQRFAIVHSGTRNISTSDDGGETWNLQTNAIPAGGGGSELWQYITWVEEFDMFIIGNDSTNASQEKLAYSADGLTFTLIDTTTLPVPTLPITSNVVYVTTLGVAVMLAYTANNSPNATAILWSSDGLNWNWIPDVVSGSGFHVLAGQRQGIAWSDTLDQLIITAGTGSNSKAIRVYAYDTAAAGSPLFDPTGWSTVSTQPPFGDNGNMDDAVWVGGTINSYVLAGEGSDNTGGSPDSDKYNLITSSDGVTWTGRTIGPVSTATPPKGLFRAKYIESLDRVILLSKDNTGFSPILSKVTLSDVGSIANWTDAEPLPSGTTNLQFEGIAVGEGSVTTKLPGHTPQVYQLTAVSVDYDGTTNKTVIGAFETGYDFYGSPIFFGSPLILGSPQFPLPGSPPFTGSEFYFPPYPSGSISNGDVFIIHDVVETSKLVIVTRPSEYYGSPAYGSPFGSPLPGSPKFDHVGSPGTYPTFPTSAGNTITIKGISIAAFNYGREVQIRNASEPTLNKTYNVLSAEDLGGSPDLIRLTVLDPILVDTISDGELVLTPDGFSGGSFCSDVPPELAMTHWMEQLTQTWRFAESPLADNFQHFILEADSTLNTFTVEGDVRGLLTTFGGSPFVISATVQHSIAPGSPVALNNNNGAVTISAITYDVVTNRSTIFVDTVTDNYPTGWITKTPDAPVVPIDTSDGAFTLAITGSTIGYRLAPALGSISGNTTIAGHTIESALVLSGSYDLQIKLNSATDPTVSAFASITVDNQFPGTTTFLTSSLLGGSYAYVGTTATWTWGTGSSPQWSTATDSGRTKIFSQVL